MALGTEAEAAPVPAPALVGRRAPGWDRWCWLVPPLVLAALGGWLVVRHHGLWYDELYTAQVAPLPLGDLARAVVSGDGTISYLRDAPPSYNAPYYAVAHFWLLLTGFDATETGLRMLSLLSAVGAAAVITRAVGRLADARIGLVAGLLVATNPFVVRYSAEARGYALALLAVALAVLGLARWLDGARGGLWLFGLAAAAAGLAHWFALLVPVGLALAALVLRRPVARAAPQSGGHRARAAPQSGGHRARAAPRSGKDSALPVVIVTAAACLPALGLVAIAVANGVGASGAEWIGGVGLEVPWLVLRAWTRAYQVLLVATVVLVVAAFALKRVERREALVVAAMWVAVPIVVVTTLELVRPVFVVRYLLPAVVGLAVLVALGIAQLPRRVGHVAAVVVLASSLAATVGAVNAGPIEDGRGAVAAVAARHQAGEPVVAAGRWDALTVDHFGRLTTPALAPDVVLPDQPVPPASTVWVVRRARPGVKGDDVRLAALDRELGSRGLVVVDRLLFPGRGSDVIVQRWQAPLPYG